MALRAVKFRLAAIYVAFTAILLAAIGFVFWHHLRNEAELDARIAVEADWGATVGFLHFDNERPEWIYDRNDPDQAYTIERLRHVYLLTNQSGEVLQSSTIFDSIRAKHQGPMQGSYNPQYSIAHDESDIPFLIRTSWIRDDHSQYGLSVGRSLALPYRSVDRFIEIYSLLSVGMLFLTGFFSWWVTGIAIRQGSQAT